jgi:predicted PurR-regulated permease PerM
MTWPVFSRLRARTRRPRLTAAGFTLAVWLLVGVPVALLIFTLAAEATDLARAFGDWRDAGGAVPEWVTGNAWVQRGLALVRELPIAAQPAQAGEWFGRVGTEVSRQLVGLAGGIARNALRFGVFLLTLFAFYLSGEELLALGRRLAPLLFPAASERFIERIGEAVRAVVFGLLGTAIVQGFLAGVGLAVAGVPRAVVLGTATALLSFLPGGGGAISLAAAVWLALQGRILAAILLAGWSLLVVSSVDNVLRPILISGRGRIPFLLVFFGALGGLASFGLIGVFLGPVLLSVSFTLVTEFARTSAEGAGPSDAAADAEAPSA